MIDFQCFDIILNSAFHSSKKLGNRDDILPVLLTTYFILMFKFPISKLFSKTCSCFHKIAASYLSKVMSKVNLKGSNFVLSITATAVTGMTRTAGHNKTSMA